MLFINLFKDALEGADKKPREYGDADQVKTLADNKWETLKDGKITEVEKAYESFKSKNDAYGLWHGVRSLRTLMLDQYLLAGQYRHTYRFAKVGAPLYETSQWGINEEKGLIEFMKERNAIIVNKESLSKVHYISLQDMVFFDDFYEVMDWLSEEWKAFYDDLRNGRFHPNSFGVESYNNCIEKFDFAFRTLAKIEKNIGSGNPAFDHEALKDPGLKKYWGRKTYDEMDSNTINFDPKSPWPGLSVQGLTAFIEAYVSQRESDTEAADEYLSKFVGDSIGSGTDVYRHLRAAKKESPGGQGH